MSGRAKSKRQLYGDEMQDGQLGGWERLRGVDIHGELEQMLGSEAQIRELRDRVLEGIAKHKRHSWAMMGVRVWMSLLFQLQGRRMRPRTTVVIMKWVSLQNDMVER
jgi:hypothetical protein